MKLLAKASHILCVATTIVVLATTFSGCKTVNTLNSHRDTTVGKKHKVKNVHQVAHLPESLRRVALLPLHRGRYDHIDMESIEENFRQELAKQNLFEVISVTTETMEEVFGEESYSSIEVLPTKLLADLHTMYAIDGVMLVDVSFFNAYQPVSLGVRVKLLDGHTGRLVWSADELFDSASPSVSNAARKYFKTESVNQYPLHGTETVLHSPTRFSKYVAAAIFSTIQE